MSIDILNSYKEFLDLKNIDINEVSLKDLMQFKQFYKENPIEINKLKNKFNNIKNEYMEFCYKNKISQDQEGFKNFIEIINERTFWRGC